LGHFLFLFDFLYYNMGAAEKQGGEAAVLGLEERKS